MTLVEAAIVGVSGCVLGIAVGITTGVAMLADAVFTTGASPPFRFDPLAAAAYAGIALLVVVAGASWPAWRVSRLQVVAALRHE
jgi:ABC-type antimicrobial peptide transport system permease subunit